MIHRSRKFKDQRYDHSPLGKARRRRYAKSDKGRSTRRRYERSAKRQAGRARYYASRRGLTVQQQYAEQPLSTSPWRGDWIQDFRGRSLNER